MAYQLARMVYLHWDQLYSMFIENLQDTYECPSTTETLKTIKQKHDESLRDYVKHFCNVMNVIPYIQDIEIINAFHDGVSDIKTVEEIAMKKPKTVADLLTVAAICIEASETRARLLESHGKGPAKKQPPAIYRCIEFHSVIQLKLEVGLLLHERV
jgi:hypothetical protein